MWLLRFWGKFDLWNTGNNPAYSIRNDLFRIFPDDAGLVRLLLVRKTIQWFRPFVSLFVSGREAKFSEGGRCTGAKNRHSVRHAAAVTVFSRLRR